MPESTDLFAEVANIRDELEEQGAMLDALVRSSGREAKELVLGEMRRDSGLGRILQLVDGNRSQGEIVLRLKEEGVKGTSPASVSRKLDRLAHELGLVILVRRVSSGNVYRKTRLDKVLGISRAVDRDE